MMLLSAELKDALASHGIPDEARLVTLGCPKASLFLMDLSAHSAVKIIPARDEEDLMSCCRERHVTAVLVDADLAMPLIKTLVSQQLGVGVVAFGDDIQDKEASLRGAGALDVLDAVGPELLNSLHRALDYRALYLLEMAHRCEIKRLQSQELNLLGHAPETMSDDLSGNQAPPLPVGPLSLLDLDAATEAFELAYIERVQQLCSSARETASCLGISSATLSRRSRKEGKSDDL